MVTLTNVVVFLQCEKREMEKDEYTFDGSVDKHGEPAVRAKTGRWFAGVLLLGNIIIVYLHLFCKYH